MRGSWGYGKTFLRLDDGMKRQDAVKDVGALLRVAVGLESLADLKAPVFLVGMFMALFVVYGFDTAGTFGEETLDASRQAPRGVLSVLSRFEADRQSRP